MFWFLYTVVFVIIRLLNTHSIKEEIAYMQIHLFHSGNHSLTIFWQLIVNCIGQHETAQTQETLLSNIWWEKCYSREKITTFLSCVILDSSIQPLVDQSGPWMQTALCSHAYVSTALCTVLVTQAGGLCWKHERMDLRNDRERGWSELVQHKIRLFLDLASETTP